jgi:rhomboid family GlyGly-CTERM serine protease
VIGRRADTHGAGRPAPFPVLTLALGALAVALHFLPGAGATLAFERDAVAAGELWRLVSGHWIHWSTDHLIWDAGTFVALGLACELRSRKRLAVCIAGASLAISAVVWWGLPGLTHYGGLSGIDCALWALLGAELWRELHVAGRRVASGLALSVGLALALKVGFEWWTGGTVFVDNLGTGVAPVPAAHLAGAAIGLAVPTLGAWALRETA